jgi:hypothetical protein
MLQVPLSAVPTQTVDVILDGQACQLSLRQNGANMYLDLIADGRDIVLTRICRNRQLLLLDAQYRGFRGELFFLDTQGELDPSYLGLGPNGRYVLVYLFEDEEP